MNDLSQNRQIVGSPAGALAPRPFCGGVAVPDFIEGASYVIKCGACSTRSTHQASASIAIAAWNRRAVMAAPSVAALAAADYAAIIKRYEDAGDQVNADIIRKQWEVAQAAERGVAALAQVQDETKVAGDAQNCRSSEKVQVLQDDLRQMIVVGGQRLGKSILLDLQRDAARYRWLRDKADDMTCTAAPMVASLDDGGRLIGLIDGDELDAAVDVAMARPAAHKRKTKRMGNDQ